MKPIFFFCLFFALLQGSAGSYGQSSFPTLSSGDRGWPTMVAQQLLNERTSSKLLVDGNAGRKTTAAIRRFQESLGASPDGQLTSAQWSALLRGRPSKFIVKFEQGNRVRDDASTQENDSLYNAKVTVYHLSASGISIAGRFRGSVMPDDITSRGRLSNGFYPLQIGFHRRENQTPTAADLKVKFNGTLRPCLVVNGDQSVPVVSRNPLKKTATAIHVHNGFKNSRGSLGCPTITPSDWSEFIGLFLNSSPRLDSWNNDQVYRGDFAGVLIVTSK